MPIKRITQRIQQYAHTHGLEKGLYVISFLESFIFPLPTDIFLIPVVLLQRTRWISIATLTTLTSVLGGIVGYLIGVFFSEVALFLVPSLEHSALSHSRSGSDIFYLTLIGTLTPVPYKLFSVGGGLLGILFTPFLLATILGRAIRYYALSLLTVLCGDIYTILSSRQKKILTVVGFILGLLLIFLIV